MRVKFLTTRSGESTTEIELDRADIDRLTAGEALDNADVIIRVRETVQDDVVADENWLKEHGSPGIIVKS